MYVFIWYYMYFLSILYILWRVYHNTTMIKVCFMYIKMHIYIYIDTYYTCIPLNCFAYIYVYIWNWIYPPVSKRGNWKSWVCFKQFKTYTSEGISQLAMFDDSGCINPISIMWGPRWIAKLVQIGPISLWFMVFITIVTGAFKPTNITGGASHCKYSQLYFNPPFP